MECHASTPKRPNTSLLPPLQHGAAIDRFHSLDLYLKARLTFDLSLLDSFLRLFFSFDTRDFGQLKLSFSFDSDPLFLMSLMDFSVDLPFRSLES
jgi:hypothetical protein